MRGKGHGIWGTCVFILLLLTIGIGALTLITENLGRERQPLEVCPPTLQNPTEIEAHVSGAVAEEGIYYHDETTSLGELIRSAGGFVYKEDPNRFRVYILDQDDNFYAIPQEISETKININVASIETLQTLHGIGETLARRIVDHRCEHGYFLSIEDIMDVKGIGTGRFAEIEDDITVVD
ncbi:MAG: helix-hairpin-helix domain-containing protein [Chloroflexota bacterium]|nr:helix-hairpin-helix domain-containing protein [Chloroflexota bacterium]